MEASQPKTLNESKQSRTLLLGDQTVFRLLDKLKQITLLIIKDLINHLMQLLKVEGTMINTTINMEIRMKVQVSLLS